jgi:hypothetical protein
MTLMALGALLAGGVTALVPAQAALALVPIVPGPVQPIAGHGAVWSTACPPGKPVTAETCYAVVNDEETTSTAKLVAIVNGIPKTPIKVPMGTEGMGNDIACPSATRCIMVGPVTNKNLTVGLGLVNPLKPTTVFHVPGVTGSNVQMAVACGSVTYCVAAGILSPVVPTANAHGLIVTLNPALPGAAKATVLTNIDVFKDVACPTTTQCLVIGDKFNGMPFGPDTSAIELSVTNGKIGTPHVYGHMNQMFYISCGSATECWVTGLRYVPSGPTQSPWRPVIGPVIGGQPGTSQILGLGLGPLACMGITTCYVTDIAATAPKVIPRIDKVASGKITARASLPALGGGALGISDLVCPTIHSCLTAGETSITVIPGTQNFFYTSATQTLTVN